RPRRLHPRRHHHRRPPRHRRRTGAGTTATRAAATTRFLDRRVESVPVSRRAPRPAIFGGGRPTASVPSYSDWLKATVRRLLARQVTVTMPMLPVRSKTSAVPTTRPSEARWSNDRRPTAVPVGRRASARLISVLMYSTPLLPQFVTILVASATEAT